MRDLWCTVYVVIYCVVLCCVVKIYLLTHHLFRLYLFLQFCFSLLNKNHKLQTANSELYEQQKKLSEEITSLQSRLYFTYLYAVEL